MDDSELVEAIDLLNLANDDLKKANSLATKATIFSAGGSIATSVSEHWNQLDQVEAKRLHLLFFVSYVIFAIINGPARRSLEREVEELRKDIASIMHTTEPRLFQKYQLSHEEQNLISDMDGTEFSTHAGKVMKVKKDLHAALAHVINIVTTFVH